MSRKSEQSYILPGSDPHPRREAEAGGKVLRGARRTMTTSRAARTGASEELTRVTRDAWLIVLARGVRAFAYGLMAVVLAVALTGRGLTPVAIGALITISLVGDFCGTYVISLFADRWGRRRTLAGLALLMAA